MSEIKNGEIEMIDFGQDLSKTNANKGLNPLFAYNENNGNQDFFSDLQPKNDLFAKTKHNVNFNKTENTSLALVQPTLKQKIIHEQLKLRNASKEEFEEFYKYFNKTDNEILESEDYKNTIDYFEGILNKGDLETLKKFLIMTYRNNFGYGIINNF